MGGFDILAAGQGDRLASTSTTGASSLTCRGWPSSRRCSSTTRTADTLYKIKIKDGIKKELNEPEF